MMLRPSAGRAREPERTFVFLSSLISQNMYAEAAPRPLGALAPSQAEGGRSMPRPRLSMLPPHCCRLAKGKGNIRSIFMEKQKWGTCFCLNKNVLCFVINLTAKPAARNV